MKLKPTPRPQSKSPSGFTLVELLVVITIIGVLMAIGIPVYTKMRSNSEDNECLEQMRTWSTVIANYSADHGGMIESRNWNSIGDSDQSAYVTYFAGDNTHKSGYQTLAKMRCCPALKGDAAKSGNGNSLTAYGMTEPTGSSAGKKEAGYPLAKVKNLSRFVIMIEARNSYLQDAAAFTSNVLPLTTKQYGRHKDNAIHALFGDFSVQTLRNADVSKGIPSWTTQYTN